MQRPRFFFSKNHNSAPSQPILAVLNMFRIILNMFEILARNFNYYIFIFFLFTVLPSTLFDRVYSLKIWQNSPEILPSWDIFTRETFQIVSRRNPPINTSLLILLLRRVPPCSDTSELSLPPPSLRLLHRNIIFRPRE